MVRNIIFVFQMKNSIPRYTFYKNKYGSELLVDVVELKYVKKFLAESAIHTLNYYDVTFITEGKGTFSVDNQTYEVTHVTFYSLNREKSELGYASYHQWLCADFSRKEFLSSPLKILCLYSIFRFFSWKAFHQDCICQMSFMPVYSKFCII